MRQNNFVKLQASVYINPFPLNAQAVEYLKNSGLMEYIRNLRVDFKLFKQKAPNYGLTQTNFSLSPFIRYYFLSSSNKINIFTDVSYIYYKTKFDNSTTPSSIEKTNGYYISAGPAMFLTNQTVCPRYDGGFSL